MLKNVDLWVRIKNYEIDDPASVFKFSDKLAKENGWDKEFALRAIEEYLKFCYLAVASGFACTPSEEVDAVWHLHILYTREYHDFCRDVLQYELHHGPTRGGKAEGEKYLDLYENTKVNYYQNFGVWPPTDIWPSSEERFSGHYVRLDTTKYLAINVAVYPRLTKILLWLLKRL